MVKLLSGILGVVLLMAAGPSQAILIEAVPAAQSVDLGDQTSVDINISGLGAGTAPSVGAYDIDVGFDASILAFNSVAWGTGLDLSFGSIRFASPSSGNVNLFEVAIAPEVFVNALQPASFTLATLTFDTLAKGLTPLSLGVNSISDASGFIPLAAQTIDGSIRVPEPSTLLLMLIGFSALLLAFRRNCIACARRTI